MKKLLMITLSLLLFTFLISPVQAKRPGPLDRPLPDYNNLSLRQIFEDGNNHTAFGMKGTGTLTQYADYSTVLPTYQWSGLRSSINSLGIGLNYYNFDYKSDAIGSSSYFLGIPGNVHIISFGIVDWTNISGLKNITVVTANQAYISIETADANYGLLYGRKMIIINLTSLGIPTATKIEMDNLYLDYVKYKNMMNATDVMLIVGQLGAFVWSLVVSFEIFGFVLWEYALFGIGAGFIGYLALKIIQKKAGDDNGDSD
jgi:hypothetical protein